MKTKIIGIMGCLSNIFSWKPLSLKKLGIIVQFLLVSEICVAPINAQDSIVFLSEVLQGVQKNVDLLEKLNTDLISEEEITIEEFDDTGKIKTTTTIISEYRVVPTKSGKLFSYTIPQEERTVLSAKENGKIKKMKKFVDPIFLRGMNSCTDLFAIFSKQNEEYFDYELDGNDLSVLHDKQNEKYSKFKFSATKETKKRNGYLIMNITEKEANIGRIGGTWRWNLKYNGVAQIDTETMEIVQLNREKIITWKNMGLFRKYFFTQIEYDKVKILDQFVMLPMTRIIELYKTNGQLDTKYKYKYNNYRTFNVSTQIKFQAIE